MLPHFNEYGLLPPGDYELSLPELRDSMLVMGPPDSVPGGAWDSGWRRKLVENLSVLVGQLWHVDISEIFVNGSFAEDKDHPNDVDGYFECPLERLASGELNRLDPHKVWTWDPASRRSYRGSSKRQLPMWHVYRVELFPHHGQLCGIRDRQGRELEFPSAFRQSRQDGRSKGIIKIKPEMAS